MRQTIIEALAWALTLDPTTLKWPAAVLVALCFGLVLFGLVQYQAFNRVWGLHLVLGLAGGAVVVGLGAAIHWLLGVVYGVGYLLTWLVWVLTRRASWWRQALARGLTAGLALGPWLWIGATEKGSLASRGAASAMAKWLLAPNGLMWFWMTLGALWLLVLVGGWSCWRWPLVRPQRRRWLVATWAVLGLLGLNWYAAGRVKLFAVCEAGQTWRLGYVLLSRPGSQWYRGVFGEPPLQVAAEDGEAKALRLLLAAGADVNARDNGGRTPLHRAAEYGKAEAIRLLLAAGGKVNAKANDGRTPLHRAAGEAEAVRLLLAAGAKVNDRDDWGETPLQWAAEYGKAEAIRLLLAARADANAKTNDGWTPLHQAAENGEPEAIRLLLDARADVNARDNALGLTPLHRAAAHGRAAAIRVLLAANADVNARDHAGSTPLHCAADLWQPAAIRLLLVAGAKVNERNNAGKTALDWAKTDECSDLLRQAGGKTGEELDGWTPLHLAAGRGDAEAIRLLLVAGAKVNERNNAGKTALDWAKTDECSDLLRQAGGKTSAELDAEKAQPAP